MTKGPLRYDAAAQELISDRAGLAYPIRDGIPIMLIDEARSLEDAAPRALSASHELQRPCGRSEMGRQ